MRIPLDYYRILSVPIKATSEQLKQAYGDRLLQQPRREYGETAIAARRKLIENAYSILAAPEPRAEYDAQFFSNFAPASFSEVKALNDLSSKVNLGVRENLEGGESSSSSFVITENTETPSKETQTAVAQKPRLNPTIDIAPCQFGGVLLILQELGEYEQVIQLGTNYLTSAEYANFLKRSDPQTQLNHKQDIILSLALAYLELGREQWHRQEYEKAAISDRLGVELLTQENLFPGVKEELEIDLYKLRPYRILELISQNSINSASRAKGLTLLQEMLAQRQGIEGRGQDFSGLTFDRFLCFIQQLRTYLTSAEQEQLFVKEAQTASPIANYLAGYALLARGFALKQPQLILRAQQMLEFLSHKQNVYWEESICALLLGHTGKAIKKLQKSRDIDNIEIIKHHSQGTGDMLPGLCFYGEQWLKEEVLTQFCDLIKTPITLKEYFADITVQKYLEELSPVATEVTEKNSSPTSKKSKIAFKNQSVGLFTVWKQKLLDKLSAPKKVTVARANDKLERKLVDASVGNGQSSASTLERNTVDLKTLKSNTPAKVRTQLPAIGKAIPTRRQQKPAVNHHPHRTVPRKKPKSKATVVKGWLFLFSLVMGIGTVGFITMKFLLESPPIFTKKESQLAIEVSTPPITLPSAKPKAAPVKPKVTFNNLAQQTIQKWLTSKALAFGKEHKIEALNSILVAPLLSTWRDRAVVYQRDNMYREYEHKITMRSATIDRQNPQKAVVEAEVKEVARHYQDGKLDRSQSYDDNLLVRYELTLQGGKWLIQNTEVLKTL